MAQSRCFTVIGDSNVQRHFSLVNARACPAVTTSQLLHCGRLQIFADVLSKVRAESTVCIVSCLTNFLTSAEGASTVSLRVEPVLTKFRDLLLGAVDGERVLLICPPMYRLSPLWYREGLPEILQKFSEVLSPYDQLHLLPSFATPQFEDDGIHLTAYSGLEFVLHLYDSAGALLDSLGSSLDAKASASTESTRRLEDRMMAIEQDHRRLNRSFEYKTAVDAEAADFQENIRLEDSFVIQGLPRFNGKDLSPKEWQVRARRDVSNVIKKLLGKELPIVFVSNATGRGSDAIVRYVVRMKTVAASEEIRNKFGFFFQGGVNSRPPHFKDVSLRNALTKNTRIRIDVLHLFGQKYTESNPGSKYKVIGYRPRPILKLFPSANASDRRVQSFDYIQAVKRLPAKFSTEEVSPIVSKIDAEYHGRVRAIFVVLNDDMLKGKQRKGERGARSDPPPTTGANRAESGDPEANQDDQDQDQDQDVDHEAEAEAEEESISAPPPTPHTSRSLSRSNKRGPPSPAKKASKSQKK